MIAHISTCKAPCAPIPGRRSNRRSTLSPSRRILSKNIHKRFARQPLAIKTNNNGVEQQIPATTGPLRLPRTLARPEASAINRMRIESSYPELAQVPTAYIRKGLTATGPDMLAAVANVHAQPSTSSLPRELEIVVNDMVAASCPTHMLAIYSAASPALKRKVTLFPTHQLVLAAHCANLPNLPESKPDATKASVKLPVVPICLPSPETYNILQSYLYTKRVDVLFASLLPSPPSSLSAAGVSLPEMITRLVQHLASNGDVPILARHAMIINGVWRNACALGVQDDQLWGSIEVAWEAIVGAISLLKGQC